MILLKFRSGELIGCEIKFQIQRVPTRNTFDGPRYPKNKKYLKKRDDDVIITFFRVFLVFGVAGSVKSMPSGYPKNKKYLKKRDDDAIITFFQVFLVFGVAGFVKSMNHGYLLDAELNSTSNKLSHLEFE